MPVDERRSAARNHAFVVRAAARLALMILPLAACTPPTEPSALEQIRARGELRVVTINSPTSYYLGTHGAEGLEFGLAQAYSKKLGLPLVITPVSDLAE